MSETPVKSKQIPNKNNNNASSKKITVKKGSSNEKLKNKFPPATKRKLSNTYSEADNVFNDDKQSQKDETSISSSTMSRVKKPFVGKVDVASILQKANKTSTTGKKANLKKAFFFLLFGQ